VAIRMDSSGSRAPIRFGAFELEADAGELRKHGTRIKLADQPLSILALLLDRPGQIVTREELQRQLWPADTFVDFDRGLNKAINRLRDALGDSADAPRFIETIPKRGYRFVGAVEPPRTDSVVDVAPATEQRPSGDPRPPSRAWIGAVVVAGLALATVWVIVTRTRTSSDAPPIVRSSLLPPRDSSYLPNNFALSPDGLHLAFVAEGVGGRRSLWVRTLTAATAQPLGGTDGATFPFWAPDNLAIGFFADRTLKVANIAGAAVRTVAAASRASGGAWSNRGIIVFAPDVNGPLYAVPSAGGDPKAVTDIPATGGEGHRWPFFLPDGEHFLYAVVAGSHSSVFAGSLNSRERTAVAAGGGPQRGIRFACAAVRPRHDTDGAAVRRNAAANDGATLCRSPTAKWPISCRRSLQDSLLRSPAC
jgi:DNA-binding winged helix-turn-helix (wHTH) protein